MMAVTIKISGNMILLPMAGHRRPTSGDQAETLQQDFPSAAKDISGQALLAFMRISGNTLPREPLSLPCLLRTSTTARRPSFPELQRSKESRAMPAWELTLTFLAVVS